MNKLLLIPALLVLFSSNSFAQWSEAPSGEIMIRGGWLFDGISNTRRQNKGIVIRDGKIIEIDKDLQGILLSATNIIDLTDADTILPGMIDLHAHYNFDFIDEGRVEEVVNNGIIFLANGVTSTWSAGEYYPERVLRQRDLIDSNKAIGPRLFSSGPYFGGFRCEYSVKTAEDDCSAWPNDITEEEIRSEVDKWADQGIVSIKIKQATPSETEIIIEQAHKHGMTTTGHLANYEWQYDVHPRDAIMMGLDRLEHQITLGSGGEESSDMEEMIDLILKYQVYYDANLQMYGGVNLREELGADMVWTNEAKYFTTYAQKLLKERGDPLPESDVIEYAQRVLELNRLYESGGENLLIVGTDEPVYTTLLPGFAFHRELLAMVYAGIPIVTVLKAATINGANALGVADKIGSIESGKLADLFVIKGNPLEDIKVTRNIKLVIKGGVVYEPEILFKSAIGSIGPKGPDDHGDWMLRIEPLRPVN
ncbi:MAG: amidohydrolase family protein [Gammaproteobacteria bacterium]|nr:amidohydrolase family protein [Gammaproteobacteria bacterium]